MLFCYSYQYCKTVMHFLKSFLKFTVTFNCWCWQWQNFLEISGKWFSRNYDFHACKLKWNKISLYLWSNRLQSLNIFVVIKKNQNSLYFRTHPSAAIRHLRYIRSLLEAFRRNYIIQTSLVFAFLVTKCFQNYCLLHYIWFNRYKNYFYFFRTFGK